MFKLLPDGIQHAEVMVSTKIKTRTVALISSVSNVKDRIPEYQRSANRAAPLFVSISERNYGRLIARDGLGGGTRNSTKHYFPGLLDDPSISLREMATIKLMLTKPWNV